jgi:MinD-like ATPase involved in chromosome partitioning or flagellar assembly
MSKIQTKKIVLTHSFKGGTGKTVIATNFAYNFCNNGYKTLIIDADLLAPSMEKIFPRTNEYKEFRTWTDYLENTYNDLGEVVYPTKYKNLDIIYSPPPEIGRNFLTEKSSSWWVQALKTCLHDKEKWFNELGYDFILLDNQNGISMNSANNITISDIGFLILRPVTYGVSGTAHLLREMYSTIQGLRKKRTDYLIWNQIPKSEDQEKNKYIHDILNEWDDFFTEGGLKPIARIYYDADLSISMLKRENEKLLGTSSLMQKEIENILKKINLI